MTRVDLLPFLPAFVNLCLGMYVLSRNPQARENRLLALGCLGISLYSFRIFEVYSRPVEEAVIIYPLFAFGPTFAIAFLSDFLLTISKRKIFAKRWQDQVIIYGPAFFISFAYAFTDWIFDGFMVTESNAYVPLPGPLVKLPRYFLVSLMVYALFQTIRTIITTRDPLLRKQLLWAISGLGISLLSTMLIIFGRIPQFLAINAALCTILVAGTMAVAVVTYGLAPSLELLKRQNAEAKAREAELSRLILDAQIREERLTHRQTELETKARQAELEAELQTAHDMQLSLMPTEDPRIKGFDIAGRCVPANQVGGDYFQYFERNGGLTLTLADVSGHAMQAAIPVVMFSGILNSQMELGGTLQDRFDHLNRSIFAALPGRTFVCLVMAELVFESGSISFVNGACPYPYHFQAKTGTVSELQSSFYPLGIRPTTQYETSHHQLSPGDWLVLCSDGVMETLDVNENLFGYERTASLIERACAEESSADAVIHRVFDEVDSFRGEAQRSDDLTCIALYREA